MIIMMIYNNSGDDDDDGQVILMDATVATGAAAMMAIRVLLDHDVPEENINLVSLLMAESGEDAVFECRLWLNYSKQVIEKINTVRLHFFYLEFHRSLIADLSIL